jgi:restriction endonuclease Mrr
MLPTYEEIEFPLLLEIKKRDGRCRPSEHMNGKTVYEALADHFNLSQEDLDEETADGRNRWANMVQWARRTLVELGLVSNVEHGIWELTDKGKDVAEKEDPSLIRPIGATMKKIKIEIYSQAIAAGVKKDQALQIAGLVEDEIN